MKRKLYYMKLLAFSLLLATIPVIIQGFFSYYKASGMIQDKVLESNRLMLQQSQYHAEQILKSVESTMLSYVNSSEILHAMNAPAEPRLFPLFNRMNLAISSMSFYEYGVKRAYLVSLNNDWVIDGEGVYQLGDDDRRQKYPSLLAAMKTPSAWLFNEDYLPDTGIARGRSDENSIVLVQKIPQYSSEPTGLAIVVFPGKALSNMVAGSDKLGQFMIVDERQRVIAHSDAQLIGETLSNDPVMTIIRKQPDEAGFNKLNDDGEELGFTFIRSTYNNWTYLSIAPVAQIMQDSRTIGWLSLAVGSAMIALILVLALLGSRKMYRPIARIYEYVTDSASDDHRDELELIRDRFMEMKNSQFAMKDQLNSQMMQLKEFFVQQLLRGELSREEITEKSKMFHISHEWKRLTVFAAQIDSLDRTRFEEKHRDLLMFAINNIVKELMPRQSRFQPVLIDKFQAAIVEHDHEDEDRIKRDMYELCEHVQQMVKKYLDVQISIGVSKPYAKLANTSRACEEALDALHYRIKYGEGSILYLKDVQPDEEDTVVPAFPRHIEMELTNALNAGDKETVEQKFVEFLDWLLSQEVSYREQQVYLARILIDVLKIAQDMRISAKHLIEHEQSVFARLFSLKTPEELKRWFMDEVASEFLKLMETRREIKYVKIAEELVNMIRDEYDNDLSLELCADRLDVHPSYLKRVLRKELDTSFSDYLSRYRLMKAREFLLQTDLKIADIAERLRYNNPQNFIRYFRKMEGMTPGEFRKRKGASAADG